LGEDGLKVLIHDDFCDGYLCVKWCVAEERC
jgi:hypothetical protein